MSLNATPSQTVGPYYRLGLEPLYRKQIASAQATGAPVQISGCIFDGAGTPVADAVLEVWQADAAGIYAHPADARCEAHDPSFDGWGRVPTDAHGRFSFSTIKPGRVAGPGGKLQAAHLTVLVFMRGLLRGASTRLYFADDPQLGSDPILALVPAERRATLLAQPGAGGAYAWDIRMQGEAETVFFRY
ncbi:protocatechuate 3,4-dioxygenase subunit alpha [Xanthomonas vasicola]|uniref:Protocatechuate 3,4-dioxygenase n=1 Tax=Xanthomonas vasicola pv. vasculorum NCPPB 890 TaxID=1184265 RepID=A0A836P5T7_XANVA|nr:protocatechuate 3,4-dioxygenase subunit alpha [Xanthomonas vasicola]KFA27061.1 protocatechuate 3,4-dioxygenase [Xanthomonas vasicola pv. vasculorum NCPPB 1381]KFA29505.1 protocatechuate 3,4-dioxygenase [Xanthomonas vasicola pv. vasculorum NCPPB 1326]MBV6744668.1 protocatechuate 3,4-dioxygenase subunit alpha [Xanthomonas vasicola pv. vasculorum NCPPB 890]MBV6890281.1 protocatechuate 3,4-dioxygenase subunit alpha [Xanthomonas vasicola pv. vasculorum]MDO6946833.1 protocatechuate 3,4-dioxygenas